MINVFLHGSLTFYQKDTFLICKLFNLQYIEFIVNEKFNFTEAFKQTETG